MVRTRVGFCGGAEVVQVDFDQKVISFQQLLDVFWSAHDPTADNGSRLYLKAVFFHTPEQKKVAEAFLKSQSRKLGRPVTSVVEPVNFEIARDSEQKYYLRHQAQIWNDFSQNHGTDVVNSAAAAKINGYLGGNSSQQQFQVFAPQLGLSRSSLKRLSGYVPQTPKHYLPKCALPQK